MDTERLATADEIWDDRDLNRMYPTMALKMKDTEFEVVTALFMPSHIDIDIQPEHPDETFNFDGVIRIEEITKFNLISSNHFDLNIAFFAEAITIFRLLNFTISTSPHLSISPYSSSFLSGSMDTDVTEFITSFKGKPLKVFYPLSSPFKREESHSMINNFFFRDHETKCAIFNRWESEFNSLDELIHFLSGYMLIS